ncbi:hypothetical protein [Mangrovicella endophytica]|uniref:hypothetical protein n=1 Tax=Mangrovicella endophytica TaxID=2066697 RepID=UPI000C9E27A4|nr:hypothetical protein [Mangrovicella endophytica]
MGRRLTDNKAVLLFAAGVLGDAFLDMAKALAAADVGDEDVFIQELQQLTTMKFLEGARGASEHVCRQAAHAFAAAVNEAKLCIEERSCPAEGSSN